MASQEKREFDKYLKFLTQKALQIIVQSREGTPLHTKSTPNNTEWFNIVLPDKREVVSELKRKIDHPSPRHDAPINVEITMETPEGDQLLVEVWHLSLDTSKRDITVSVVHSLYPKLSTLLKSLLVMTRVVPAYQLSRKKEELKFGYTISCGKNENEFYSTKDVQRSVLGEVFSPYGLLSISVEYITVFTMPEKVHIFSSTDIVNTPEEEDSEIDNRLRPFYSPFSNFSPQLHNTRLQVETTTPFSKVLPQHFTGTAAMLRTPSNETPSSYQDGSLGTHGGGDPLEEDKMSSITVHSAQEGFLILDINEMRPAFRSEGTGDDLFHLSTDPLPSLDMFNDGTDITTACTYLDEHLTHKEQTSPLSSSSLSSPHI